MKNEYEKHLRDFVFQFISEELKYNVNEKKTQEFVMNSLFMSSL